MKYAHILMAVASEFWAIDAAKFDQIVAFLALQAAGEKLTAEQVARISNKTANDVARREGAVALLPLRGVLANRMSMMSDISGGTSYDGFARQLDNAVSDSDVKAIVIDVDSPGGVVTGADELSSRIFSARGTKPIIAHVNGSMASAAYWVGSSADEIVLTPSSEAGSIGILGVHDDVSAALEKAGVKKTVISAGKFKAEGSPFGPLSEEAIAHRNERAQHYYDTFVRRVAENRGKPLSAVRDGFGQGRMVTSAAAIAEGMADRVASLDETLARFGVRPQPQTARTRAFAAERERRALDFNS